VSAAFPVPDARGNAEHQGGEDVMHAEATFKVENWDETPILDSDDSAPRVTRALVTKSFSGDIAGDATVEWLMGYQEDGTATFVGLERFVGSVGGRSGSFVLQHNGTFDGSIAQSTIVVVPGSGTDDLRELRGEGTLEAGMGEDGVRRVALDYELD
jgi:hypothetical protein